MTHIAIWQGHKGPGEHRFTTGLKFYYVLIWVCSLARKSKKQHQVTPNKQNEMALEDWCSKMNGFSLFLQYPSCPRDFGVTMRIPDKKGKVGDLIWRTHGVKKDLIEQRRNPSRLSSKSGLLCIRCGENCSIWKFAEVFRASLSACEWTKLG